MTKCYNLIAFFLRCWSIWGFQLLVSQFATSQTLKLTLGFLRSHFPYDQKSQNKTLNTLRMKRAFKIK